MTYKFEIALGILPQIIHFIIHGIKSIKEILKQYSVLAIISDQSEIAPCLQFSVDFIRLMHVMHCTL